MLSVAYSPDGTRVACGSMGGTVAVFDVATAQLLHTLPGLHKAVRCVTWGADSATLVAACDDGHAHVYDGISGTLLHDCSAGVGAAALLCASLSRDGTALVTGGADGCLRLWDARRGKAVQKLSGEHAEPVWGVAFSPSGAHCVSVSDDKALGLYALA